METVIIAVGSNMGDRISYVKKAGDFLESLSEGDVIKSSVWDSEPIGGARYHFLNCAARIQTSVAPEKLLKKLKNFEQSCGRKKKPTHWGPRVIDLDLISYGNLVIQQEDLIIPHPEYKNRLFVLLPLQEIDGEWRDPVNKIHIEKLIKDAAPMDIQRTDDDW